MYQNEEIAKALNSKYRGATIDTITANGDVIFRIGGSNSYSRVPAREVSNMVKSYQYSQNPKEDLHQIAKDAVKAERIAKAEAKQAKVDEMSADSQAIRDRNNSETSFSGRGQSVLDS